MQLMPLWKIDLRTEQPRRGVMDGLGGPNWDWGFGPIRIKGRTWDSLVNAAEDLLLEKFTVDVGELSPRLLPSGVVRFQFRAYRRDGR